MFTGIISDVGEIVSVQTPREDGVVPIAAVQTIESLSAHQQV